MADRPVTLLPMAEALVLAVVLALGQVLVLVPGLVQERV